MDECDESSLFGLKIDSECLIIEESSIDSGQFGSVYSGVYRPKNNSSPTMYVAIKQVKERKNTKNDEEIDEAQIEFIQEAKLMRHLKHPHVIELIGVCFNEHVKNSLRLVLEFATLGQMSAYLRANPSRVSMDNIVLMLCQIAEGMVYLVENCIVHRDLAARNILLVSETCAKISDFGLSRKTNTDNGVYDMYLDDESKKVKKLPLKWYPPSVCKHGRFEEKADVWSFGVTCWEATSYGQRPYQGMDIGMVHMKLENGYRLERPLDCPPHIYNIMFKCWLSNKRNRPTFKELVEEFKRHTTKTTTTEVISSTCSETFSENILERNNLTLAGPIIPLRGHFSTVYKGKLNLKKENDKEEIDVFVRICSKAIYKEDKIDAGKFITKKL
jgi:serine/threonine protein kinase